MDIDKIFIVVITMLIDTANIRAIGADGFCTLLDEGTYLFDPFFYSLNKFLYPLEFMSLFMKDFFYTTGHLFIHSRVVMEKFLRRMVIHYFLINLNTDTIPRATDEAAAATANTLSSIISKKSAATAVVTVRMTSIIILVVDVN